MLRGIPTVLLLIAMTLECACSRPKPETYGSVHSPSGSMTAIKQEKGEEEASSDVLLIEHAQGHDRKIALLTDQPLGPFQVHGNDGVVMAWEDDHHLTLGSALGSRPARGHHGCMQGSERRGYQRSASRPGG